MILFLPAITVRLFSGVLGADDAPFGPVMPSISEVLPPARGAGDLGPAKAESPALGSVHLAGECHPLPLWSPLVLSLSTTVVYRSTVETIRIDHLFRTGDVMQICPAP